MKTKEQFVKPAILRVVSLQTEGHILGASLVDESLAIISDGQEVVDIDASSEDFDWNNSWEWE